jgi:hypothetical protein
VDYVECHVGGGAVNSVHAEMAGTRQLVGVPFNTFPRPIYADLSDLRPARATCEQCHAPKRFIGDRLPVKTAFVDDEKNSMTKTMLVLHLGGVDSLSHMSEIHGHHLDHLEYVASDSTDQTIIAVDAPGANGSVTGFAGSDWKGPIKGVRRVVDCMDCHKQATHVFQTAEDVADESMASGRPSADLPFVHKEGLQLIQATYPSQAVAAAKTQSGLEDYYRTQYPTIWNTQRGKVEGGVDNWSTSSSKTSSRRCMLPGAPTRTISGAPISPGASAATMATILPRMARRSPTTAPHATTCWQWTSRIPSC